MNCFEGKRKAYWNARCEKMIVDKIIVYKMFDNRSGIVFIRFRNGVMNMENMLQKPFGNTFYLIHRQIIFADKFIVYKTYRIGRINAKVEDYNHHKQRKLPGIFSKESDHRLITCIGNLTDNRFLFLKFKIGNGVLLACFVSKVIPV